MKHTQLKSLLCLLATIFVVGCQKGDDAEALKKENAELQADLKKERQARDGLSERLTAMEAQINKSAEEAGAKSEARKAAEWNAQIDKIIAVLERVRQETDTFSSARTEADLVGEAQRLKSIAREQESAARQIVAELRSCEFPKANELDTAIKNFTSSYGYFVAARMLMWQSAKTLGSVSKEIEDSEEKHSGEYRKHLRSIGSLKVIEQ